MLASLTTIITGITAGGSVFAATYNPLYFTANQGPTLLYREHAPINSSQPSVSESLSQTKSGTIVTLQAGSGSSAGFVTSAGPIGSLTEKQNGGPALSMIQVKGTGSYQVALWVDTNSHNDSSANGPWFSWSGPLASHTLTNTTGNGGDSLFIAQSTPTGNKLTINGDTSFYDVSNGQLYTLNDLQNGQAGVSPNDPVAVWVGTPPESQLSATITGLKVNSTPVPLGQLPEVPYAAAIPMILGAAAVFVLKRRKLAPGL